MNEMTGTISSIDAGSKTLRLSVEGGYTPQFDYDANLRVESNGRALTIDDLRRGDPVVVRYVGRDMTARQIEKKKAHAAKTVR
jgi:hypothetical protein